jgi:hypothetical protein
MTSVALNRPSPSLSLTQPSSTFQQKPASLNDRICKAARTPFDTFSDLYNAIFPKNPLTQVRQFRFFPESLEIAFGGYNYKNEIDSMGGPWTSGEWRSKAHNQYVGNFNSMIDRAVKKMIPLTGRPHLPFEMTMIDVQTVNAWAKMGGKMGIHRALIERAARETREFGQGKINIEDILAAVIAHELAHVGARHTARTIEISLLWFTIGLFEPAFMFLFGFNLVEAYLFSSYSRSQEFEADRYGMIMMKKAGYNPKAAIWAQHFLKDYEATYGIRWMDWIDRLFWDHPTSAKRIKANEITLAELENASFK